MDIKPLEWIAKSARIVIPGSLVLGFSLLTGAPAFAGEGPGGDLEIEIEGEETPKDKDKEVTPAPSGEEAPAPKEEGKEESPAPAEGEKEKPKSEYLAFPEFGAEIDAHEATYVPQLGITRSVLVKKGKLPADGELVSYKFKPADEGVLLEIHSKGKDGKETVYAGLIRSAAWDRFKTAIEAGAKKAKEVRVEDEKGVVSRFVLQKEISDYTEMAVVDKKVYLRFKGLPGFSGNGAYELTGKVAADYSMSTIFQEEALMKMKPEERAAKVKEIRAAYDTLTRVRIGVGKEGAEYFLELYRTGQEKPEVVAVSQDSVAKFLETVRRMGQWRQHQEAEFKKKGRALKQKDDHSDPKTEFGRRDAAGVVVYGDAYTWAELQAVANEDENVAYVVGLMNKLVGARWVAEKDAVQIRRSAVPGEKEHSFYFRAGDKDSWHEFRAPGYEKFNSGFEKLVELYSKAKSE
ncbi:hypothetical protein KY335_05535 [Candidatus Woesearchaeota archaeon]|nr:hypothetical protein [Candidatus Woesearchaeota archaeon]